MEIKFMIFDMIGGEPQVFTFNYRLATRGTKNQLWLGKPVKAPALSGYAEKYALKLYLDTTLCQPHGTIRSHSGQFAEGSL